MGRFISIAITWSRPRIFIFQPQVSSPYSGSTNPDQWWAPLRYDRHWMSCPKKYWLEFSIISRLKKTYAPPALSAVVWTQSPTLCCINPSSLINPNIISLSPNLLWRDRGADLSFKMWDSNTQAPSCQTSSFSKRVESMASLTPSPQCQTSKPSKFPFLNHFVMVLERYSTVLLI